MNIYQTTPMRTLRMIANGELAPLKGFSAARAEMATLLRILLWSVLGLFTIPGAAWTCWHLMVMNISPYIPSISYVLMFGITWTAISLLQTFNVYTVQNLRDAPIDELEEGVYHYGLTYPGCAFAVTGICWLVYKALTFF